MTAKQLGAWFIAWGIISIMISFVGLQLKFLWFLDEMGPIVGYGLKIGLIVIGCLIWRNADRIPAEEATPAGQLFQFATFPGNA